MNVAQRSRDSLRLRSRGAYGQAHVGDRLYGTARYRLRSLDLATGGKRTVAELTDRGIVDLVGVPERPLIEPGQHRPKGPTATTGSSSSARCSRLRTGRIQLTARVSCALRCPSRG